jgi:hypothetical protein
VCFSIIAIGIRRLSHVDYVGRFEKLLLHPQQICLLTALVMVELSTNLNITEHVIFNGLESYGAEDVLGRRQVSI